MDDQNPSRLIQGAEGCLVMMDEVRLAPQQGLLILSSIAMSLLAIAKMTYEKRETE